MAAAASLQPGAPGGFPPGMFPGPPGAANMLPPGFNHQMMAAAAAAAAAGNKLPMGGVGLVGPGGKMNFNFTVIFVVLLLFLLYECSRMNVNNLY